MLTHFKSGRIARHIKRVLATKFSTFLNESLEIRKTKHSQKLKKHEIQQRRSKSKNTTQTTNSSPYSSMQARYKRTTEKISCVILRTSASENSQHRTASTGVIGPCTKTKRRRAGLNDSALEEEDCSVGVRSVYIIYALEYFPL